MNIECPLSPSCNSLFAQKYSAFPFYQMLSRLQLMKTLLATLILLIPILAAAQDEVKVPDEVKPFVEKGMQAIAVESGDLNGDGTKDYVLVLSKPRVETEQFDEAGEANRPTLILIRDASGKLSLAASNDRVAYCRSCGGVFGDPFQGVEIKGMSFTVSNYGGSSDRWTDDFTFAYSRRDHTWQLTRVEKGAFNVVKNEKLRTTVYTAPKSFGLINFADFNPEEFKGKGKR
jgi:hypothetical protein